MTRLPAPTSSTPAALPATPSANARPRVPGRTAPLLASLVAGGVFATALAALAMRPSDAVADDKAQAAAAARPALTVTVVAPERRSLPVTLAANGSIAAWQEASIGSEVNGLRLAEVRVGIGDAVKRGQVLATFAADTVQAELAQLRAGVAEAEAQAAAAAADAERARSLQATGALSAQQISQLLTTDQTARARLEAARAAARAAELRLRQTHVLAPDHGVISARQATVGAVVPAGQELFRLIRQGRLEWRAEVPAADLARVRAGQAVLLRPAGGDAAVRGRVRLVGPTVDPQTRNGLVYVDLVGDTGPAKAGMFARGELQLGDASAVVLPQAAVLLRDGFASVLVVGADDRVSQRKVTLGRRAGDRVEITSPLPDGVRIVGSGGAFLADGDRVRVVDAPPAQPPAPSTSVERVAAPTRPAASAAR
jgi:HlyD family secretion protein